MAPTRLSRPCQVAALPGLTPHQPRFPAGEPDVRRAGEDGERGEEGRRLGARGRQRHAVRALRRLSLRLSLQNLQDVLGQHILGVQGKVGRWPATRAASWFADGLSRHLGACRRSATPWRPRAGVRWALRGRRVRFGGSGPVCGVPGRASSLVRRCKGLTSISRASVVDGADVSGHTFTFTELWMLS